MSHWRLSRRIFQEREPAKDRRWLLGAIAWWVTVKGRCWFLVLELAHLGQESETREAASAEKEARKVHRAETCSHPRSH